jgi:hypothetical protein
MPESFSLASILAMSPAQVWARVTTPRLLREVAAPLLRFRPALGEAWPELWAEGQTIHLHLFALGLLPLGPHTLTIARVDGEARTIQTRESSPLLLHWEHRINVKPAGDGHARYTDTVHFDAGRITPTVAPVVRAFFAHRHRRWQSLVRRLGTAPSMPYAPAPPQP